MCLIWATNTTNFDWPRLSTTPSKAMCYLNCIIMLKLNIGVGRQVPKLPARLVLQYACMYISCAILVSSPMAQLFNVTRES